MGADPVEEVKVGFEILKSLKLRTNGINFIACPSCSRQNFDVVKTMNELETRLEDVTTPLDVAVIGCIVNGAGLAMATMDAITLHGGSPANFLDVGGGASPKKIANAFRIVRKDTNVKAILLNIFAGINRCDWVAAGVVQAMQKQAISEPVIVRLSGTNYELGQEILNRSGMPFINAADLDEAARKAVSAVHNL